MMSRVQGFMAILGGLLILVAAAHAQIRSSAITGTVTDASGAVVPDVKLTVTDQDTGVSQETKSNQVGEYTLPYLAPGRYTLAAELEGFQQYLLTDVVLGTATTVRADIKLTTGAVATAIEVAASAAVLQTESSVVQGSVDADVIANLPNMNNNPLYYATLQAGVVGAPQVYQSTRLGVGFQDRQWMSAIRINGGQMTSNWTACPCRARPGTRPPWFPIAMRCRKCA